MALSKKLENISKSSSDLSKVKTRNLIYKIKNENSQEAWKELYDRYHDRTLQYIKKIVPDKTIAEDILGETFYKVNEHISTYNPEYQFTTWIYTIAGNFAIDHLRRKKKEKTFFSSDQLPRSASKHDQSNTIESLPKKNSEVSIVDHIYLERAIDSLPPKQKEAIKLIDISGYSYEQCVEMMGLPMGTIKSRLFRAREMIKDYLSEENIKFIRNLATSVDFNYFS